MKLLKHLLPHLGSIKSWVFADGKFKVNRAIILVVSLVVLIIGSQFVPVETLQELVSMLDDISDAIGYSD